MKLLTIVIPCFNSAEYIDKCISSMLIGDDRVHIVIVDDGSTDSTGLIADTYAELYPNYFTVIHQSNSGHGEGINQGIRHAKGKYFKVVDSDDWLSKDFKYYLDELEKCDSANGADLIVTNYYYEHADNVGNKAIQYNNVFTDKKIHHWNDTGKFRLHQLLTIHSCTFNTEFFRRNFKSLPKHIFYEDNLMVYQLIPYVDSILYLNIDLYRYFIGREGQSVQKDILINRYEHQLIVTELCFESYNINTIAEPMKRKYLSHELFLMLGISVLSAKMNCSIEVDQRLNQMWKACYDYNPSLANYYRKHSILRLACIPGITGYRLSSLFFHIANRFIRFN